MLLTTTPGIRLMMWPKIAVSPKFVFALAFHNTEKNSYVKPHCQVLPQLEPCALNKAFSTQQILVKKK